MPRKYSCAYYAAHREQILERQRLYRIENRAQRNANNAKHYHDHKAWINECKSGPCVDCKRRFPPCVMDFDHVRGKKAFNISQSRAHRHIKVVAEIQKCDLVCSNCHRIRTQKRHKASARKKHDCSSAVPRA